MSDKLIKRMKEVLDQKLYSMPKEQREAEQTAGEAFMREQFAQMAFNDIFEHLQKNAAGIAFAIESKLVGRQKAFERVSDGQFKLTLGSVTADVELRGDQIAATITKGDPPAETEELTFHATVQDGSIFLTRTESPMSIYPDDVLGDILEAMIKLVD